MGNFKVTGIAREVADVISLQKRDGFAEKWVRNDQIS